MAGTTTAVGSASASPVETQKAWEQSVPLNQENSEDSPPKPAAAQELSLSQSRSGRQPLSSNANGSTTRRRGSKTDMNGHKSGRLEALARKESGLSRSGSEADSLLDLYNQNGEKKGEALQPGKDGEDPESAKWIHRDKLAKIESEELQQAGIRLPSQSQARSTSKASRRTRSRDRQSNSTSGDQVEAWPPNREEKRQRVASPIPAEDEENVDYESWDLRTAEEIAADPFEDIHRNGLKKTSSRIPVLTSSPLPVPLEHIERDTPLQRKRNPSGSWSREEEGIAYNKGRSRSQSEAGQLVFDDVDAGETNDLSESPPGSGKSLQQGSPSKSKATPGSTTSARKTSANHSRSPSQQKQRTPSANNKTPTLQRPVTRGGEGRPSTAVNRPEGDPPWLATMYKPDPRLPPDQQILPTHAKRLQREQWEKEGKYGSTFDREFAPLAVHTSDGLKQPLSPAEAESEKEEVNDDENAWPLRTAPRINDSRPETSGTDHGGYSTMPKVQNTPPIGLAPSPKIIQKPIKQHEKDEPQEEDVSIDKGCGCCIVM